MELYTKCDHQCCAVFQRQYGKPNIGEMIDRG